jgi:hypothetical protein
VKPGDLVKHPRGMKNVCAERYFAGVVLEVTRPKNPIEITQCLVLWRTCPTPLVYCQDQLEVINECR